MGLRDFHPAVLATALATFGSFLGIGIVDPILPSIARELGASHFMVMFLFTSYLLVMGLANLVAGALATRIGSKRTMLLGLATVAVFAGGCALVSTVESLAILRGFWGLGNALFTTTALAIMVGVAAGNGSEAISLYEAALGFGIACGPLLGGLLGAQSWRLPFAGASVLMIVAFRFVVLTVEEPEAERQQRVRDVLGTFRHTGVFTNAVIGLLYTFGFFTLLAYTPLILGLSTLMIGFVFFAWGILLIVGSAVLSPRLNRRFGTPETTAGALTVFAGLLGVMWVSSGSTMLSTLVIVGGFLCGILNANLTTLAMGISTHSRSAASGAFNSLRFTGGAFAPITAGYLGQAYGATVPFLIGAGAVGLGLVVLLGRFGEFGFAEPEPTH
ncbi:MFS transporter [Halobacterium salinarum]|uniref:MFS transporter n=1 Tax=Halobacterium salinarum TaxID=2242 RepID=UPI002554283A|nr:MFS transporter [Halobacterium salinarum]MDL0145936.1 MFS transporter [Halobacterium salinarum]